MPIGCASFVPEIVFDLFKEGRKPSRILDLGIGMGIYGAVVRQWLDMGVSRNTYIMGVEGFSKYENPCWQLYDYVHVCSIQSYLDNSLSEEDFFDCIFFFDVIEHFEKEEGIDVLKKAIKKVSSGGLIYVGTPSVFCEQSDVYGNTFEVHRSLWSADDFTSLGFSSLIDGTDHYGCKVLLYKLEKN
ncbi:MAG: methyltransferase domain-containing protein [Bacteroidia bacterium]